MLDFLSALEKTLFYALNHHLANPFFDGIARAFGDGRLWIAPGAVAAAIWLRRGRRKALKVLSAAALAVGLTDFTCAKLLKPFFHRERPCVVLADCRTPLGVSTSFAFPSNHAAGGAAGAAVLALTYPAKAAVFAGVAFAVGLSRVYAGKHWPSDVLAGWLYGAGIGWGVFRAFVFRRKKPEEKEHENTKSS